MKVYLCFNCSYDEGAGTFRNVEEVFERELDASDWVTSFEPTDYEWREYMEWNVK